MSRRPASDVSFEAADSECRALIRLRNVARWRRQSRLQLSRNGRQGPGGSHYFHRTPKFSGRRLHHHRRPNHHCRLSLKDRQQSLNALVRAGRGSRIGSNTHPRSVVGGRPATKASSVRLSGTGGLTRGSNGTGSRCPTSSWRYRPVSRCYSSASGWLSRLSTVSSNPRGAAPAGQASR